MAKINIEELFKGELDCLWNKAKADPNLKLLYNTIARGYAIEKEIETNSILFVSMNPSFSTKVGTWNNGESFKSVFYEIPVLKDSKGTNNFFNAINNFYNNIKDSNPDFPRLAHHDLLFIRETTQENVLNWKEKYASFFKDQLDISKRIIIKSDPKLIVVLNAGARKLFKEMFGNPNVDKTLGARIYRLNENKRETPVLFSGMLSGGRALDLGSKESLQWHIEYILKQIGYKP